ncbi:hypothetical protein H4R99_008311, partial [Coemansia sp. RSA 1722]
HFALHAFFSSLHSSFWSRTRLIVSTWHATTAASRTDRCPTQVRRHSQSAARCGQYTRASSPAIASCSAWASWASACLACGSATSSRNRTRLPPTTGSHGSATAIQLMSREKD